MEATYVASGDQEHVPWLVFFASIRYLAFAILSFESSRKKDIPYVPFIFKVMAVFWVMHIVREVDMRKLTLEQYYELSRTNSEVVSMTYLTVTLLLLTGVYVAIKPMMEKFLNNIKKMHKTNE